MSRVLIIAEAGVNHNGNIELAKRLVEAAAEAGADVVKFQTFQPEEVVTAGAPKAAYQEKATGGSQLEMIRGLALPPEAFHILAEYCNRRGISFLSSPFDLKSVDLLARMGLKVFKIPSGEITNLPYLRKIGGLQCEVILSTGMSTLEEVATALEILGRSGTPRKNVTLLHCTSEYPAPYAEVNLRCIATLMKEFPGVRTGYSDHTLGIEIPIAAAALGAAVIEKHFTLDRDMEGPDHRASLMPGELATMVQAVRHVEAALGDGHKRPMPSEIGTRAVARKSIVAARPIKAGERFTEENLAIKRPGIGMSPTLWDSILGSVASRDLEEDELL